MFLMFARIGLTNTLVGLAILHTAIQLPLSLYVLRNSFSAVPGSWRRRPSPTARRR
jgi:multiple sugar transport system permease protein